jgi:hypothetical protein
MRRGKFSSGERAEKRRLRCLFFREITKSDYKVIKSLRKDVYIPYRSVFPVYSNSRFDELEDLSFKTFRKVHPNAKWADFEHFVQWEGFMEADDDHYPELIPVRNAVINWSQDHNLDANWCRETAVATLDSWAQKNSKFNEWEISYGTKYRIDPDEEDRLMPSPAFPPYLPFKHSTDEYLIAIEKWARDKIIPTSFLYQLKDSSVGKSADGKEVIDSQIEAEVKSIIKIADIYCASVNSFYAQLDYTGINSRPEEAKHLRWTVRSLITGKSYLEIGEEEKVGEETVKKAVQRMLHALELSRKKGRQKGHKDSRRRHIAPR